MQNFIYIVRFGALEAKNSQFNLSPYYYSSFKKAVKFKGELLAEFNAENTEIPFTKESSYNAMVDSIDFDGVNSYNTPKRFRILIEKERVF